MTTSIRRRRLRDPRTWGPVAVIGVLAVVYVAVVVLYWRSTESITPNLDVPDDVAERSLIVGIDATAVNPQTGTLSAQLKIFPPTSLVADDGTLRQKIEVLVVTVDPAESGKVLPVDGATQTFEQGAPFLTSTITLYPQGRYQNYPLERYVTDVGVAAFATGEDGEREELPTVLGMGGDVPGWVVRSGPMEGATTSGAALEDGAELTLVRAGSTVAIVAIILVSLLVLVTAALLVARSVWMKKRRIEATMASWFAALMFAVIPLRTNLPGAPPMGVWIDFLVVLWVEVGLMIALAVFIASWLSYTPLPDYAPERLRQPDSE